MDVRFRDSGFRPLDGLIRHRIMGFVVGFAGL